MRSPGACRSRCPGPGGSEGDETVVSITAQAIEAEAADQWSNVAWEAASDVDLTAITVLDREGNVTERTEEFAQGAATDVAGLWFCGTIASNTEVEVLGVQLAEDEGRTGSAWAMLLLVLGLGVLAVGVGVIVWRHWPPR